MPCDPVSYESCNLPDRDGRKAFLRRRRRLERAAAAVTEEVDLRLLLLGPETVALERDEP